MVNVDACLEFGCYKKHILVVFRFAGGLKRHFFLKEKTHFFPGVFVR